MYLIVIWKRLKIKSGTPHILVFESLTIYIGGAEGSRFGKLEGRILMGRMHLIDLIHRSVP